MEAGREYLRHLLSEEQLALYRVVTRDADRFPELGRQYQKNFARDLENCSTSDDNGNALAQKNSWISSPGLGCAPSHQRDGVRFCI